MAAPRQPDVVDPHATDPHAAPSVSVPVPPSAPPVPPATDTKKTVQEQKDIRLEKRLNKIHEAAVFLKDTSDRGDDFLLDAKSLAEPQLNAYSKTCALFHNNAPDKGAKAIIQTIATELKDNKQHIASFNEAIDKIDTVRLTTKRSLNNRVVKEIDLLLNKQEGFWEDVSLARWKKTFDDPIKPLMQIINDEIKAIEDEKDQHVVRGYEDTDEGKKKYANAKALQIRLLKQYAENINKEIEYLKYTLLVNALSHQKFFKKNNSQKTTDVGEGVNYGKELDLQHHHREQLVLRAKAAIDNQRLKTVTIWRPEKGNEIDILENPEKSLANGKYCRADRWTGRASYFSWHAWVDPTYEVGSKSVSWTPVSYRTSKKVTIEEDIDGALLLYCKKTGSQTGFIRAGNDVSADYLVKLSHRAAERGFHLKLAESTRSRLEMTHPDKLMEIENNLNPEGSGLHLQAEEHKRPTL